ncbi:rpsU-divergently transcribed protein [Parvibaculum lavamentivorans DS-1]|uniref:RpsU-divergently transcribed protein n=1 Tax=Parvibaculum lavamentivorans (strain DS-1 / DSM 13023 / NCIMB 13966) TaxID=402881 RepID=A7HUV0_PARL1|nr:COQ9 family protein [Parvibaculum lavamentivorans]ABS63683.1 rpsU-divergently transcribed protein [Parvibaculum lavamentivorans DS-1]
MPETAAKPKRPGAGKAKADHLEAARARILAAALPNVAFDGWTPRLLKEAAEAAGISHGEMRLAFPDGVVDLVDYFLADGDRRMAEMLAKEDIAALKIRERITLAVRTRMEVDILYREAMRRAVTLLALPVSGTHGPRSLYRTVDAIWRAVGDTSTDFNFYTKRATLAGVFSSVTLYWFADDSEGFANTWAFLDRRIDDVMRFEKAKATVKGVAAKLPDPFALLGRLRYRNG